MCAACTDLVLPLVDHLDYRVRQVAAWWLARRGISQAGLRDMLTRLSQPDSFLARNAADVLGEFGYAGSPSRRCRRRCRTRSSRREARAAMARALGPIGAADGVPGAAHAGAGDAGPG